MTLILGCLTPKYAIHVSDRYISKDGVTVDKNRNKGTVIRERFVMAYSGPDTIDGINTDIWLAKLLVQRSTTGRFWQDVVLKEVQNAIPQQRRSRKGKRLAIVVTGWASDRQGGNYAVQTVISNAIGTDGCWMEEAAPLFQAFMREASGTDDVTFTQPIGKPVKVDDWRALKRGVRGVMKSGGSPTEIARLMGQTIRATARWYPDSVSKQHMVTIIPHPSLQTGLAFATGDDGIRPPSDVTYPATYLVHDESAPIDWVMPNIYTGDWLLVDIRKPATSKGEFKFTVLKSGPAPFVYGMRDEWGRSHSIEIQPNGTTSKYSIE